MSLQKVAFEEFQRQNFQVLKELEEQKTTRSIGGDFTIATGIYFLALLLALVGA